MELPEPTIPDLPEGTTALPASAPGRVANTGTGYVGSSGGAVLVAVEIGEATDPEPTDPTVGYEDKNSYATQLRAKDSGTQGPTYGVTSMITVADASTDVNWYSVTGRALVVFGTDGDDLFTFEIDPASYHLAVHGLSHDFAFPEVASVALDGDGGSDVVKLTGFVGNDVVNLWPGGGRLARAGTAVGLTFTSIEKVEAQGGGDLNDRAYLYGAAGNDSFWGKPTYGKMTGTGSHDHDYACLSAAGANVAGAYGSSAGDRFQGYGDWATLFGAGFRDYVKLSSPADETMCLHGKPGAGADLGLPLSCRL